MKVTKKLLIAALLVMGITLIACNNGNGGSPGTGGGSSGGTGGGGSGTGGGSGNTTLPANKGTDPFEGLELLIRSDNDQQRYEVDTEKKTIVVHGLIDDTRTDFVEYNYSYDNDSTTTPTTITLKMTKITTEAGPLTPIEELQGMMEGMEGVVDMEYILPILSQLRTYTVDISNQPGQQATVTFKGQYNNNSPWYEQRAGLFSGTRDYDNGSHNVSIYGNRIEYERDSFPIIEVTDSIIKCISMKDKSSKEFPYTITGSGKDTKVTITVDGSTAVACSWQADIALTPFL